MANPRIPTLEARTSPAGAVDADVVCVFQDSGKKAVPPKGAYAALVERMRKGDSFGAKVGATQFVRFGGKGIAENSLLVGLGAAADLTEEKIRSAGGSAWQRLKSERVRTATVQLDSIFEARGLKSELSPVRIARAFAEGLMLGAYEWTRHRTRDKSDEYAGPSRLTVVTHDKALKSQLDRELDRVTAVAEAVQVTRDWSNEPSNIGTPEFYAAEARKLARHYGLKVKILTEKDAARERMGLFLGVGQGAEREGRIVVLEHAPKAGARRKTVALVGKGVTFDSGGISIKPSMRMEEMKHDMTGAATVMGAMILAARWNVPNKVVGILAFTENMPSGNAIQPGNVIRSRSGKTVEVVNTDAEGRLILADALDYAQDLKPDAVVDVATLTGAVSIALGKYCCGIMGNDTTLIEAVRRAGDTNGERLWELPMWDDYFDDLRSDSADMRNVANDSYGGTIRGGIFLKQFIRKGVHWAHLDIAATAWGLSHLSYYPKKGASGAYVRTLAQFAADF
jgi:leucyl aminopeptidase